MHRAAALLLATAGFLAAAAWPTVADAQTFEQQDWQLACDNTRTCRAAGYQREGDLNAVSVLFTRDAGPRVPVSGELRIGPLGRNVAPPASLRLTIAGKAAGTVVVDRQSRHAWLPGAVVDALLKALAGTGSVVFSAGSTTWRLSGQGAAAVLMKMDEMQGRVDTASAIVRRGTLGDVDVLLPMAPPVVQAVRIGQSAQPGDDALAERIISRIPHDDDCPLIEDRTAAREAGYLPQVWHVDASRVLLKAACWRSAAGSGDGYWVAITRPPYDAKRVTLSGTGFDPAVGISSRKKGREAGDCVTEDEWTWNGYEFAPTLSMASGMCRAVADGGAWKMPTVVTQVIPAK